MNSETKQCQNCKNQFVIEPDDFSFYEKVKVPPPTFCPECRLIRRLIWRNERALYRRKCDLCQEMKIVMYSSESPHKVYCYQCWWSDKWSAKDYSRDYDFSKPFFEQFKELLLSVPRPGIVKQGNNIESEYTNRVTDMRNCYLVYGTTVAEYCRYGVWLNGSKECVDGHNVQKSERCYECTDCFECYGLAFSQECNNCTNSWFLLNCRNCQDCFGCVNLRNKSYCIFNQQYTKEEYQKVISGYNLSSAKFVEEMRSKFNEFKKNFIVPAIVTHHSSNVSGNWIENSKEVLKSFNSTNVERGKYLLEIFNAKDVMDYSTWGATAELVYEQINSGMQVSNVQFGNECWSQVINMQYVSNCHSSHGLFGCIGLRNSEYCILNKQYSKEEYGEMLKKIREHMESVPYIDKKGRKYTYGEFYPFEISPFAYNETIAQEFFSIDKTHAEKMGYPWKEPEAKNYQITMEAGALPDDSKDAADTITKETIACAHAGKCNQQCTGAFKILSEDLQMYKVARLPLPRLCPNCRYFERLKQRNPLKLWHRQCMCSLATHGHSGTCPNEFETSYAPERSETVYCLECYRAEVA